jgi:hypothetical protein
MNSKCKHQWVWEGPAENLPGYECCFKCRTVRSSLRTITPTKVRPDQVVASLHDLRCVGPSDCSCTPYLVRETPTEGEGTEYTSMVGVATNIGNMRAARLGATPLGRAARHSGVDE